MKDIGAWRSVTQRRVSRRSYVVTAEVISLCDYRKSKSEGKKSRNAKGRSTNNPIIDPADADDYFAQFTGFGLGVVPLGPDDPKDETA